MVKEENWGGEGREGRTVDMVRAAGVVTRDEGVEERDAICVCGLHAAEGSGVDDGLVVGVAVSGVVEDAAIDTLPGIRQ